MKTKHNLFSTKNKDIKMTKDYKNYGEVDFEDHEIDQTEERYDKLNKELEDNQSKFGEANTKNGN